MFLRFRFRNCYYSCSHTNQFCLNCSAFYKKTMVLGEVFLGAFLQVLFDKLSSRELLSLARREGIQKKLEKWTETLSMIRSLLVDAEEKQLTDKAVKQWLDDLRDLAYDLEDILDEFATEVLRRELVKEKNSKVRNMVSYLNPKPVIFSFTKGSKIEEISSRLEEIRKKCKQLNLGKNINDVFTSNVRQRPPTTCLRNEPEIYGRDVDKRNIIELIFKHEPSDGSNFRVIPIVGMGGVGKTTLARFVYNDKAVEVFQIKAWVCVSDDFDVTRVTRAILESITLQSCDLKDLNQIQLQLKNKLDGKKFLLVLDDVWNKNYGIWEVFKSPFMVGAPGSRIILTTREADVALLVGNMERYALETLDEEDCWCVFARHAFENCDSGVNQNLAFIQAKVAEKCKGLPLAARTLGGLLRCKQRYDEWEEILNSKIWNLTDEEGDVLPVLRLSYYHLPSHLKRCFAFCALLPRDYEFEEKELVRLWMAEGLILQSEEYKQMEDIGGEYFRHLVSRSLFQLSSSYTSRFRMHDLVNDLAQQVAGKTCFRLDDEVKDLRDSQISKKVRHLAFLRGDYDGFRKFEAFDKARCLRTFLPISGDVDCYLSTTVHTDLLPKFKYLRVLSLNGYNITKLPDSIGDIKLLRYLDLSFTLIRNLPKSISYLYNLQTLLLVACHYLKKLPQNMDQLISLRHIDMTDAYAVEEMPLGIDKLINLLTLSDFVVGNRRGSEISVLVNLRFLRGRLCISSLENVTDARDAQKANLSNMQGINVLELRWGSECSDSRNPKFEADVLDVLQPYEKLQELKIRCFGGLKFPTWIGNPSFSCMEIIRLENCERCISLPPLGLLPALKQLDIVGMSSLISVGVEFYGVGCTKPFPSLESLLLEDLQELTDWIELYEEVEGFLCLHELTIKNCPKLSGRLPSQLPSLDTLVIKKCDRFVVHVNGLPSLRKLEIDGCKEVVCRGLADSSSLNSMVILNVSKITGITRKLVLTKLEGLTLVGCEELTSLLQSEDGLTHQFTSLRQLVIEECPQLVSLVAADGYKDQLQNEIFCGLESLELTDCKRLEKLPQWFHSLMFLRELTIQGCSQLASFPDTGLPSMLRELFIKNCYALGPLPGPAIHNSSCLIRLRIHGCDSLVSFGRDELPPTLKVLDIYDCKNLRCLLDEGEHSCSEVRPMNNIKNKCIANKRSSLESLFIEKCPSLSSLASKGELPTTLKHLLLNRCAKFTSFKSIGDLPTGLQVLEIRSCGNLESIVENFPANMSLERIFIWCCKNLTSLPEGLNNLSYLHEFKIFGCQNLVSFPEGGLPASNLRVVSISQCENLKSLPDSFQNLTVLQELEISTCRGIVAFPEEGFPTCLKSLTVNLNICKPLFEWGLHKITSLRKLSIYGGCEDMVSFPQENMQMMFPSSLTSLTIRGFPSLEYISLGGFENLTSLEFLSISHCPKLKYFQKSFPLSLSKLLIESCPLLKQRCKKDRGLEWGKISTIPYIQIDSRFIYDPEDEDLD